LISQSRGLGDVYKRQTAYTTSVQLNVKPSYLQATDLKKSGPTITRKVASPITASTKPSTI
jgi:hypothetical protein